MTPEERERTMDFILAQLAQFSAEIEKERVERVQNEVRNQARTTQVETCIVLLTDLAAIGAQRLDRLDHLIERLADKN